MQHPRRTRLPHARGASNGLAELAALVADALTALGAQPAFAVGDVTRGSFTMAAVSAPTDRRAGGGRLRARASRSLDPPTHDPDGPSSQDDPSAPSTHGVSDEHAEMWSLVRLAQDGDGDAFGVLYDRYVDTVFRFAYYRVNDRALAEDVTSETFVRALRRIRTISYQGRDIGAWFITIARNIVLDHLKSARHRLESTTAEILDPDTSESTEATVLTRLDSQRLMAAVSELGDEQRDCVMMRFVQGLSVAETAAALGKNDGAVKALQHRAVRKLATIIGDDVR